jgi:hypothetical protein
MTMNIAHALHETSSQPGLIDPISFPACRNEVTEAWLKDTLSRHPVFQSDPIQAVHLSNLGDGIGQLSALTLAEIDCRSGRRVPLVVKLQAAVPEMHQVAMQYDYYGSEVNFYRELAADVPMHTPEVYVSAMDSESDRVLIIMEAFTDWHSPDQIAGATAEQVAIAADELAGLASAYWNDQPQARLPWLKSADSQAFASLPEDHAACLPVALERFEGSWPGGAAETLQRISTRYADIRRAIINGTQVLSHWDFRVENLFFGPEGELAVIDWQLMHMDNPANDLAYLLGTNVDIQLRREIEGDIMALYLRGLREQGVSDYGMAELVADYRLSLLSLTAIPLIGGANMDIGNQRSATLFAAMGGRLVKAIQDWDAVALLDHL